jgi:hypothetical protein
MEMKKRSSGVLFFSFLWALISFSYFYFGEYEMHDAHIPEGKFILPWSFTAFLFFSYSSLCFLNSRKPVNTLLIIFVVYVIATPTILYFQGFSFVYLFGWIDMVLMWKEKSAHEKNTILND